MLVGGECPVHVVAQDGQDRDIVLLRGGDDSIVDLETPVVIVGLEVTPGEVGAGEPDARGVHHGKLGVVVPVLIACVEVRADAERADLRAQWRGDGQQGSGEGCAEHGWASK